MWMEVGVEGMWMEVGVDGGVVDGGGCEWSQGAV